MHLVFRFTELMEPIHGYSARFRGVKTSRDGRHYVKGVANAVTGSIITGYHNQFDLTLRPRGGWGYATDSQGNEYQEMYLREGAILFYAQNPIDIHARRLIMEANRAALETWAQRPYAANCAARVVAIEEAAVEALKQKLGVVRDNPRYGFDCDRNYRSWPDWARVVFKRENGITEIRPEAVEALNLARQEIAARGLMAVLDEGWKTSILPPDPHPNPGVPKNGPEM